MKKWENADVVELNFIATEKNGNGNTFDCEICPGIQEFNNKRELKDHMASYHQS